MITACKEPPDETFIQSQPSTDDLLKALIAAPETRRADALKALRGLAESPCERPRRPLLVGMGEGASLLGVSRSTLWRILAAGKIKKIEIYPGAFRIRRADLEDLAAGKEV